MVSIIRIKRNEYVHILDSNTNVERCLVGPLVYTLREQENIVLDATPFVSLTPRTYCIVENPCVYDPETKEVKLDRHGQALLRMGDAEVRSTTVPFPLYPGEILRSDADGKTIFPLLTIPANQGYRIRCLRSFTDASGQYRKAGSEWIVPGPDTYLPSVDTEVLESVEAYIVKQHTALKIRATIDFTDASGVSRKAGERWLFRKAGAYLPSAEEEVEEVVNGIFLHSTNTLHLFALYDFVDFYGIPRKAGQTWLIKEKDASVHIPEPAEKVLKIGQGVTLNSQQYCIIKNPCGADGVIRYGERKLLRTPGTFLLSPGEEVEGEIRTITILGKDEALLVKALESFVDEGQTKRNAGETWMVRGPIEYIPSLSAEVLERRHLIPLDKNEGIYIMNIKTGVVRSVIGTPYMPDENEVLWEKKLPPDVEELLANPNGTLHTNEKDKSFRSKREKFRIVRFNVQPNAAVQIYNYKEKVPRIVLGPDLVMLAPDEEFTVLSLSGGTPKVPNTVQSLQLFLGPRFSSDTIVIETSDHARLKLSLSYNWHFDVTNPTSRTKIFSVPDFVGDCCKTIASRVRGAVAGEDFDSFHRNSAKIIRTAVFGVDKDGNIGKFLRFPANNFVVTNIDVQSVEPTDVKTRDSLQKSVQLAIEITTKSQEAAARHGNDRKDQEAKGHLERQRLLDKIEIEKAKTKWLKLQAQSEAIQASGQSVAEARAKADALLIEAQSDLKQAEFRAKAYAISAESELQKLQKRQEIEIMYTTQKNSIELEKAKSEAQIEVEKVRRIINAIGKETIIAIAKAGPEMQAKLLGGLGLKGYLITDGKSPINLFDTAQSMIASQANKTPHSS